MLPSKGTPGWWVGNCDTRAVPILPRPKIVFLHIFGRFLEKVDIRIR